MQGRQSGIKSVGAQRGGAGNFGVFLPRNGEKIEANSGRGRKSVGARAPTAPTSLTPLAINNVCTRVHTTVDFSSNGDF